MMLFWALCASMIGAVSVYLARPLRSSSLPPLRSSSDANIAVYRRQLAEIRSERRRGALSVEQCAGERDELERRLVRDLEREPDAGVRAARPASTLLVLLVVVAVPTITIGLYLFVGAP